MFSSLVAFLVDPNKSQIPEDVKPLKLPRLSYSGLFFARIRHHNKVKEEGQEADRQSYPLIKIEPSESKAEPDSSTYPSQEPKGLSVVEAAVSPTGSKRFRFEEYSFDYEKIEGKQLAAQLAETHLKKLLDKINGLLDQSWIDLELMRSRAWPPLEIIEEVKQARRELGSCQRDVLKKIYRIQEKIKKIKNSRRSCQSTVTYNLDHICHGHSNLAETPEDVSPPMMLSPSPPWPGVFLTRIRRNSKVDDEVECPCSRSTTRSSSESSETNVQPAMSINKSAKRKGLSVVDNVVSPTGSKRFRFEEYCVDYEKLERKERKKLRKEKRKERERLNKRVFYKKILVHIDDLLELTWNKLEFILSIYWLPLEAIEEAKKRRRALGGCKQVVQKKMKKIKNSGHSRHSSAPFNPDHVNHVYSNL